MSNERFTQGEWNISIEQITPTSNKTGYAVYTESFDVVSPMLGIRNVFDAHLIAAAPDMYRALRRLVSDVELATYIEFGGTPYLKEKLAEIDYARAALAKADGETK